MGLNALKERLDECVADVQDYLGRIESGEELSDEEVAELEAATDAKAEAQAAYDAERKRQETIQRARLAAGEKPANPSISDVKLRADEDPKRGFANFGDYAKAVKAQSLGHGYDQRLAPLAGAATTYSNEGTGVDGGFLVPDEFASAIKEYAITPASLLPLTDILPVSGNNITIPVDQTTPWGTTGVTASQVAEGAAASQTKVALEYRTLRMNKIVSLCPVTDELESDAAALSAYLPRKMGSKIDYKISDQIVNGNGAGEAEGFVNSGALVTIAKETSQTADTINANNVSKMFGAQMNQAGCVWIVNPDAWNQLPTMTIGDTPIFTMPGSKLGDASPSGTLFGRPVIVSQTAQTLGDAGDIYCVDLSSYASIVKGVDFAQSIHLYFDANTTAYRATMRYDGQSYYDAAISNANGSGSISPFVRLAARA